MFLVANPLLAPRLLALLAPRVVLRKPKNDPLFARVLLVAGGGGLAYLLCQAFAIGLNGWQFGFLGSLFGPLDSRQFGLGYGAAWLRRPCCSSSPRGSPRAARSRAMSSW